MLSLIKHFKKSISLALLALTIFWLPNDIESYSQAWGSWRGLFALFSREAALWVLLGATFFWLFWTELRPFVQDRQRKLRDIKISSHIYAENEDVIGQDGSNLADVHRVSFYLVVSNQRRSKATLRNVSARFHLIGAPTDLIEKGGSKQVDVRHGEYAMFFIGYCLSLEYVGAPTMKRHKLNELDASEVEHNLPNGHLMLRVGQEPDRTFNIGNPSGVELSYFPFTIVVSADDTESSSARIDMDLRKLPDLGAAFKCDVTN